MPLSIRSLFCWLLGHSLISTFRFQKTLYGIPEVEVRHFRCQHCNKKVETEYNHRTEKDILG